MGKRHSVAVKSAGAVFERSVHADCEMICTTTEAGAKAKASSLGFNSYTSDWRILIDNPSVDAVVIASPQETHREIAEYALKAGKPVLCEKPIGASLDDAKSMTNTAKKTQTLNMVGFNYIRTPATQYAKKLIERGELGKIVSARFEHHEDFYHDPLMPASWRTTGKANGALGDLAPHVINLSMFLLGPIKKLCGETRTVHKLRPASNGVQEVTNDDIAQFLCQFQNGATGNTSVSRVATGRKMGLAYEIFGTHGAIRFDQEDQNSLWFYRSDEPLEQQGYRKILSNGNHPDYAMFCEGPGHGTGYQDQLIIQMHHFLEAVATKKSTTTEWPSFADGLAVAQVIESVRQSAIQQTWLHVNQEN